MTGEIETGTLFTGFGGVDVGMIAAGLRPRWGFEIDARIAAVANDNLGGHVHVANILDVDPATVPYVDAMHASPPCPSFSQAKTDNGETEDDIALARKVAQFIDVIQPRIFTLENVYDYRNSQSWRTIEERLFLAGYWVDVQHVNAADYGVPQTRKRMIVRAVRGGWVPYLPPAQKWIGWYEAIEDLIPVLPESQFAPWQLKRLPEALKTCMVAQGGFDGSIATAEAEQPALTITANTNQTSLRAFLIGGANTSDEQAAPGVGVSMPGEPVKCVSTNNVLGWRAFINSSFAIGNNADDWDDNVVYSDEPFFTLTRSTKGRARAFIVDGQNARPDTGEPTRRDEAEPVFTISATAHHKGIAKAQLRSGRVVGMTARALARFQSFPDWYKLPESNKTLAAKGIGNAVPPLLYQHIIKGLMQS